MTTTSLPDYTDLRSLRRFLTEEISVALGLPEARLLRRVFTPLIWMPIHLFSKLGIWFDQQVSHFGFCEAARRLLPRFVETIETANVEVIPREGPLILCANHPGTVDSLALTSLLPRNVKIVASWIPFLRGLPVTRRHLIFAPRNDPYARMLVIREAIRHLESGGALLIFASGHLDPDPAVLPGVWETFDEWSPSLDIFLRKVPETTVQLAIVSHTVSPDFINHPFTRFKKTGIDRQRIAEILQVMRHMVFPKRHRLRPCITFGEPFLRSDMQGDEKGRVLPEIIARVKALYREHEKRFLTENSPSAPAELESRSARQDPGRELA